jgi:hypothetical protein
VFYLNCPPTQLSLRTPRVHALLWECAHIQLEIVHDLTFNQQGVFFPACLPARVTCNMWDQSTEKLIEEVEKRPALYLKSLKEYSDTNHKKKNLWEERGCTALIENWNGLAPEEKKTEGNYLCFR